MARLLRNRLRRGRTIMRSKCINSWIIRAFTAISLAFGIVFIGSSAVQAQYGSYGRYGGNGNGVYQIAQQNGYNDGMRKGQEDAREGHNNPTGTSLYRNADNGYNSRMGNKEDYRSAYRQAFLQGFAEGQSSYYDNGRNGNYPGYGNGNGSYYPNRRNGTYGGYPNNGGYPSYGGYGNDIYRIAQQNGYNDGVRKGQEDAREGHSNPTGTSLYRNADNGYNRSMGNREQYREAYRQAFMQGFADGQRGAGYYRNGRH